MYIAIVQMEMPVADRATARTIGLSSAPKFVAAKENGLLMKYYLSSESGAGGVYVWKSKEDAEAWYTPEWYAFMKKRYAEPRVYFYDSVVQVDNMKDQVVVDDQPMSLPD